MVKKRKKEIKIKKKGKLPDNIEEFFLSQETNKNLIISRELFTGDENVDLKTDLTHREIALINALLFNDDFLKSKGMKKIFSKFLIGYMRLKYSLDRKSRTEFVDIQKEKEDIKNASELASNIQNLKVK